MASLTDRALVRADDIRLDVVEEARKELSGQSRRKWALVLIAFTLGAAVAVMVIAVVIARRNAETISGVDEETEVAASGLASADETPARLVSRRGSPTSPLVGTVGRASARTVAPEVETLAHASVATPRAMRPVSVERCPLPRVGGPPAPRRGRRTRSNEWRRGGTVECQCDIVECPGPRPCLT